MLDFVGCLCGEVEFVVGVDFEGVYYWYVFVDYLVLVVVVVEFYDLFVDV